MPCCRSSDNTSFAPNCDATDAPPGWPQLFLTEELLIPTEELLIPAEELLIPEPILIPTEAILIPIKSKPVLPVFACSRCRETHYKRHLRTR